MIDNIKYFVSFSLVVLGILFFYLFTEYSSLIRVLTVVFSVIFAIFVFYFTEKGKSFFGFVVDARQEVRKVVWPTKKESNQTTLVVIVVVIILGLILWLIDTVLSSILSWIII